MEMNYSSFIGLVNNAALLLALVLLYDVLEFGYRGEKSAFQQISTGFIVGLIGIAIMLNPWDSGQGVVFDTRSVLLCISGFFLGTIPLLLAVLITSVFRLFMGGAGAWTGVAVIMTSGGIGLAWRHLHRDRKEDPSTGELYLLGIVVHVSMLAWMLSLPWQVAIGVLSKITLPVMLIHPLATALLGKLMVNREKRKQSEEALRESEGKYRDIFENIQDVYYETSIDGSILEISPSIERVSQYKRNELVGKSLYDIYADPEDRSELLKLILDKGKVDDFEINITDKDGSHHPCSISTLLIRDEQDNPIKLVGTIRDISERKRAENERKQLEAQLLQAQKMESIGNLAGGIAHDFNNILSSVIGFAELSLDEVEKGTHLEDNLQEIYAAGKRAKDLVRQILAFARQSKEELKPIQVDMVATEALKFIRSSIPTTIEIKQNIESDSLIMGNNTQVHQVLMNLFTNAAHAMEDQGGILEFSLKDIVMDWGVNRETLDLKPGDYIEIKVSDTGVGIAPEIIGSIFEPYFTTKDPGEGTGMGLAMVHGIIKSYGGKISVDSKPGQGTLFTIYLPVARKRQAHGPYQSETLPTGKERILFVDDEAAIAKMGGHALEGLGYTVSIRTSSIEALELFRTKPNDFDLAITDMTMPNMTGDQLAIALMKIRPDIPVILCTGYSKKISDESASGTGIKAFVYKPVVKADLAKTIRKVLDEAKGVMGNDQGTGGSDSLTGPGET